MTEADLHITFTAGGSPPATPHTYLTTVLQLPCSSDHGHTRAAKLTCHQPVPETHNFPTGVAPFPGAATGIGGRLRDGHATGTGSLVLGGTAGYCVGNLQVPVAVALGSHSFHVRGFGRPVGRSVVGINHSNSVT